MLVPSGKPVEFVPVYAAVFVPLSTSRWPHTCTPRWCTIIKVINLS